MPETLVVLGCMLLLGLAADSIGRRTAVPRATLLLACGVLVGDGVLGLIPASIGESFELIANLALMMIGFLLGGKLTRDVVDSSGRELIWISMTAAVGAAAIVGLALLLVGVELGIAILLGCISAATAPAAIVDTVLESGTESRFSRLLLAIVAVDDAWALVLFSLGLAAVSMLQGMQGMSASLLTTAWDILGAVALGAIIGLPAAKLTGRVRPGRPMLTEALGLVLVCGGAALWLEVSFLIATMTMGACVANLASHHEYPFHELENVEAPFMVIFFVLAGASLQIDMLTGLGLIGLTYLVARTGGKILGAGLGARASGTDERTRRWIGVALLPQAGVPIGLALLAVNQFPEYEHTILPIVIASTVAFDLIGPILTRLALKKTESDSLARR